MEDKNNALQEYNKDDAENKKKRNEKIKTAIKIAVVSFIVLFIYRLAMVIDPVLHATIDFHIFPVVICVYMITLTLLVVVYIIYNRGFSRKGITPEMLPNSWSIEKKEEFISSGERRLTDSKWMLVLIIAFLVNFSVDALELFVISRFF